MQTTQQKIISTFFIFYLVVLIWIIVFKLQLSFSLLPVERGINLIPFYDPNIERLSIYLGEKIYNMILFVPFGLYICLVTRNWTFFKKVKPIFITSLAFELIQLVFGVGACDITDLIQNTLGGVVGIGICSLVVKVFKERGYMLATILAIGLTIIMMIAILLIKTFIKIKLN